MKEKRSDSSTSSAESEDSDSDSKEPTVVWVQSSQQEKGGIKTRKGLVPTLGARMGTGGRNIPMVIIDASGPATTTNTPTKSTQQDSEKPTTIQATLGESIQGIFPTSISFVQDFLAKRLALQGNGKVSRTLVERFSSRYAESRKLKDLHYFCLRMSGVSSATIKDLRSRSSSNRWRNWGTGSNGRYLTANISEFPRIGEECSLSDILEEQVDEKYFLSQSQVEALTSGIQESKLHQHYKAQDTLLETIEE